jgi:hypothetical protein
MLPFAPGVIREPANGRDPKGRRALFCSDFGGFTMKIFQLAAALAAFALLPAAQAQQPIIIKFSHVVAARARPIRAGAASIAAPAASEVWRNWRRFCMIVLSIFA